MSTYLLEYTLPNLFSIVWGPLQGQEVRLMTGINEISAEDWAKIENHPLLPFRFKKGHLKFVEGKGPKDSKASDKNSGNSETEKNPLLDMKPADAVEMIAGTFNLDLLEKWQESETRKKVLDAIEKQIKEIAPANPRTKKNVA